MRREKNRDLNDTSPRSGDRGLVSFYVRLKNVSQRNTIQIIAPEFPRHAGYLGTMGCLASNQASSPPFSG